jgi:hypothetical protein
MPTTIFFSWQADTNTKVGRNLVERALEKAVGRIGDDSTVEEAVQEIEVDRDTKGVAGSPPIVETIFRKIDNAAAFVPDLTFVATRIDGRPSPNPNVLVEYGWALKSLSHSRIVSVMNTAFGEPTAETMPFDMAHLRRPILYYCPVGADDETCKSQREALAKVLEGAIRDVLGSESFKESLTKAPEPPKFYGHELKNDIGKFRPNGEPLGVTEGYFGNPAKEIRLSDGPAIWLRVMPVSDPGRKWSVAELKKASNVNGLIMPLLNGAGGYGNIRAPDGIGIYYADGSPTTTDTVFLFNTGELWSIDTYLLNAMAKENGISLIEDYFKKALDQYSSVLTNLGIAPPYRWIAGMDGIRGRGIYVPSPPGQISSFPGPHGRCLLNVVAEEGLHSPGDAPLKSLKPFFFKLFDSCGVNLPEWLFADPSHGP